MLLKIYHADPFELMSSPPQHPSYVFIYERSKVWFLIEKNPTNYM